MGACPPVEVPKVGDVVIASRPKNGTCVQGLLIADYGDGTILVEYQTATGSHLCEALGPAGALLVPDALLCEPYRTQIKGLRTQLFAGQLWYARPETRPTR